MKLLVDAGNTNVKWAWLDRELSGFGECAHAGMNAAQLAAEIGSAGRRATSIWIAGVVGSLGDELAGALEARYNVCPQQVRVQPEAFGIRVRYTRPERLGVDRWLAMIAARAGCVGAVCVADAGTALTVDAVMGDGTHLGGAIGPGVAMMQHALLSGTAQIAQYATDEPVGTALFADDTAAAVRAGARYAAAALIERAAAELDEVADEPAQVFLTGGAAGMIAPLIRRDVHVLRELVLRGLAIVAAGTTANRIA